MRKAVVMAPNWLLNKAAERMGVRTDEELARALGLSGPTVLSKLRTGQVLSAQGLLDRLRERSGLTEAEIARFGQVEIR